MLFIRVNTTQNARIQQTNFQIIKPLCHKTFTHNSKIQKFLKRFQNDSLMATFFLPHAPQISLPEKISGKQHRSTHIYQPQTSQNIIPYIFGWFGTLEALISHAKKGGGAKWGGA
jgi:hypothetical protein